MKAYCSYPWTRLKIDDDGSFQSCCHQKYKYGNFFKDELTIEQAMKGIVLREVRVATLNKDLHTACQSKQCPISHTNLDRKLDVELTPYPKDIELALPATWCNIGGLNPTPSTACIMCPRSSKDFIKNFSQTDNTEALLDLIKPAIPHLTSLSILGVAEPFYKGRLFEIFDKVEFKKYKEQIFFWTFCNGTLFGKKYQDLFLNEYTSNSCMGFSIDAATPETYKKIRRLDYYKTIVKNLERYFNITNNLPQKRDWSFVTYNINLLNLHEVEDMLRFGNNIGANKVQYTLTYTPMEGIALDKKYLCNEDNWEQFYEKQLRLEQLSKELNQKIEFYVPLHGGFLKNYNNTYYEVL